MPRAACIVALSLLALTFDAHDAVALTPPWIVVAVGPRPVRVQLSLDTSGGSSCGESSERKIADAMVDPKKPLVAVTSAECVCVRHTYDNFPTLNWAPGSVACRPVLCDGRGHRVCRVAPDPTIRVTINGSR